MRTVLMAVALVSSSGCRTDAHSAAPERGPQPAPAAVPAGDQAEDLEDESNEFSDDDETALRKARARAERTLAKFRAEPVDAAWASITRTRIEALRDDVSPEFPSTVKAGTVECRQTTCLFENFHADESTVLPLRPLLTRKVYGQLRAQGYECAMAQHPWTNPDGSVVERNYFMFRR
ncbi:MAG: hypothetical protein KF718_03625 [Polyangiaceae bacterium]|nr:hypothetical protein [Polyangiaceae bacterium]